MGEAYTRSSARHQLTYARMEVRLFPNSSRPGVGLKPRREAQRPLLPQHARPCPALEAARGPARVSLLPTARALGVVLHRLRGRRPLPVRLLPDAAGRFAAGDVRDQY